MHVCSKEENCRFFAMKREIPGPSFLVLLIDKGKGSKIYTLRNEGSLAALKEPLRCFCVTGGSFDGVGFF